MKILFSLLAFFLLATPAFADTLTVYPDTGSGSTTVDGYALRHGQDETFANMISNAGTSSGTSDTDQNATSLKASTTNDQFQFMYRAFYTFDTSSLTAGATGLSATLSLYGVNKSNSIGDIGLEVVASTQASDNNIVNADYSQQGGTSFGSVSYASFSTSSYNDIVLNGSGVSNISLTGVSKFGTTSNWDVANSFGGSWASNAESKLGVRFADHAGGTATAPKLVVTFTPAPSDTGAFFQLF